MMIRVEKFFIFALAILALPITAHAKEFRHQQLISSEKKMTMPEMDALRQQIARCWNVLAAARYENGTVVDIQLLMNPDRTIEKASILNTTRYNADSRFREAADAAMDALISPKCSPLDLPSDKYQQWKEITVRFDPREVL